MVTSGDINNIFTGERVVLVLLAFGDDGWEMCSCSSNTIVLLDLIVLVIISNGRCSLLSHVSVSKLTLTVEVELELGLAMTSVTSATVTEVSTDSTVGALDAVLRGVVVFVFLTRPWPQATLGLRPDPPGVIEGVEMEVLLVISSVESILGLVGLSRVSPRPSPSPSADGGALLRAGTLRKSKISSKLRFKLTL